MTEQDPAPLNDEIPTDVDSGGPNEGVPPVEPDGPVEIVPADDEAPTDHGEPLPDEVRDGDILQYEGEAP